MIADGVAGAGAKAKGPVAAGSTEATVEPTPAEGHGNDAILAELAEGQARWDELMRQTDLLTLQIAGGDVEVARQMIKRSYAPTAAEAVASATPIAGATPVHLVYDASTSSPGTYDVTPAYTPDHLSPDGSTIGNITYSGGDATWTVNEERTAAMNANLATFDRQVGGFLLALPLAGAGLSVAPVAAELYGMGTTGFYATTLTAGGAIGGGTEYATNLALNQSGTFGGYASSVAFGGLGSTFSIIGAESKYVLSLSRFSGISGERIAAAGNGFVYGSFANATGQGIDILTGQQVGGFNYFNPIKSGLFGAAGGAALPQYYGMGAVDRLNIATYRALWGVNGTRPAGASPLLVFKAEGATQLPVTIGQPVIGTAVEIGTTQTARRIRH